MEETEKTVKEETQSVKIGELAAALAKVQGGMKAAEKDGDNPFYHSTFASLASAMEACRKLLSDNGLAIIQTMGGNGDKLSVITTLMHTSDQWIKGTLSIKPPKPDPQAAGSAITYMRRYSLMAIVGIVPADDDGEGAMPRNGKPPNPRPDPKPDPKKPIAHDKKHEELSRRIGEWMLASHDGDKVKAGKYLASITDELKMGAIDSFTKLTNGEIDQVWQECLEEVDKFEKAGK